MHYKWEFEFLLWLMIKSTLKNIHFKSRNITYFETYPKKANFFHFASNNIIIYNDALSNKNKILQDNKQRCGVYKSVYKINSKSYVGSSVNLSSRFSHYFSLNYLTIKPQNIRAKFTMLCWLTGMRISNILKKHYWNLNRVS